MSWFWKYAQKPEVLEPQEVPKTLDDIKQGLVFEDVSKLLKEMTTGDKYSYMRVPLPQHAMTADLIWLCYFKILCDKIEELESQLKRVGETLRGNPTLPTVDTTLTKENLSVPQGD